MFTGSQAVWRSAARSTRTSRVCKIMFLVAVSGALCSSGNLRCAPGGVLRPASSPRAAVLSASEDGGALAVLGGALARVGDEQSAGWRRVSRAWVRLPASTPWATLHFVGGAGLGIAPQLCYDTLLSGVCDRAGIMVIATAYDLGTDHSQLAREVGRSFEAALAACRADGLAPQATAPIYRLGHSLGAKLCVLLACADDSKELELADPPASEVSKLGLIAYNNFGVAESAEFSAKVIAALQGGESGAETGFMVANAISVLQQLSKASGADIEFSPSPAQMQELVASRFAASDSRVWRLESDELDCSETLLEALPKDAACGRLTLPGAHLAPVAFCLSPGDIDPMLGSILGSGRTFSLGDPEAINAITDAVLEWLWPAGLSPLRQLSAAGPATESPLHGPANSDTS